MRVMNIKIPCNLAGVYYYYYDILSLYFKFNIHEYLHLYV